MFLTLSSLSWCMLFEGCVFYIILYVVKSVFDSPVGLGYQFINQSDSLVLDAVNDFSIALGMPNAGMPKEF